MKKEKDIFIGYLKKKGLKWTAQREAILEFFLKYEKHVSAENLYDILKKKFPSIGLSTIYRTLKLLSECGLAQASNIQGCTTFEHKYNHPHHDHLICTHCGKYVEFINTDIEKLQESVAKEHGFSISGHRLEIFGLCHKCSISPNGERPYLVVLTGGIASGKSTVSRFLMGKGFPVIDTDIIARKIVTPGSSALGEIVSVWGEEILNPDGTLNRKKLGAIVFSSERDRKKLEKITHPRIVSAMMAEVNRIKSPVVFMDIPLFFETGVPIINDQVWLVYCKPHQQLERLMKRDNIGSVPARIRLDSQIPIEKKKELAGVIIDNSNEIEDTLSQVKKEIKKLNLTPENKEYIESH